jgi:hypothetical protein
MTVHDSSTLSTLIDAFENSVIFEESAPTAYQVANAFTQMRWSNGGLVLIGVRSDGVVIGLNPEDLDAVYDRFGALCKQLTNTKIELGTLTLGERLVVFMIFNTTPSHLAPMSQYSRSISNAKMV